MTGPVIPSHRATDETRTRHPPKTAKELGLAIPRSVTARADQIIE